jgi:hypothetical protein
MVLPLVIARSDLRVVMPTRLAETFVSYRRATAPSSQLARSVPAIDVIV